MQSDRNHVSSSEVETLIRDSAPIGASQGELEATRRRIGSATTRPAHRARTMLFLAAVVAAILVASVSWRHTQTSEAFAVDRANAVLFPTGAALHVVTTEADTGDIRETWLDIERNQARDQNSVETSFGREVAYLAVMSDGRIKRLENMRLMEVMSDPTFDTPDDVVVVEEPVSLDGEHNPVSWMLYWADETDRLIRSSDSGVCETTTPDGDAAWSVTWTQGEITHTVLLGQSDYRPISLAVDWKPSTAQARHYEYTVSTWETVAREDVPEGTFDPDTVHRPEVDQISVSFAPDDPRLEAFDRFPAWRLAEDSELGPIMGGHYDWCDHSEFAQEAGYLPLHGSGKLTIEYHYAYGSGSDRTVAVVGVSTYPSAESTAVEAHWSVTLVGAAESSGEINGRAYRLRTSVPSRWAILLSVIDGQTVEIAGPTEESVLTAFKALERL